MKSKKIFKIVLLFCMMLAFSLTAFAADEAEDGSTYVDVTGFNTANAAELSAINASDSAGGSTAYYGRIAWLDNEDYGINANVFAYYPTSRFTDSTTSMVQIFYVYFDEAKDINSAWDSLAEDGFIDIAEEKQVVLFAINPIDESAGYTEADYETAYQLSYLMTNSKDTLFADFSKIVLKKLYVFGEGAGADFVNEYLTDDIFSGMVSANVLVNASKVSGDPQYAVPTYLINCTQNVVDFYKTINEADATAANDSTAVDASGKNMTVYYNSTYVMESGYTPKRVIVANDTVSTGFGADLVKNAWDVLVQRVWNSCLENAYFTEGVEGGVVSDRPVVDEIGLVMNYIDSEEAAAEQAYYAETTGYENDVQQSRWYEWVPKAAYKADGNGNLITDGDGNYILKSVEELKETYGEDFEGFKLIATMHGNGDHEIYEAESNGWVQLAGDEGDIIIVSMQDIYLVSGFPPEGQQARYGENNATFIRDLICEKYYVDRSRVYVAGFSAGGWVTSDTSAAAPEVFAAAAAMAFPADGYLEIFPYVWHDTDAVAYDIPMMYMAGRNDRGNSMENPTDKDAARVMSAQLFFNEVLTFNEMYDNLLDLVAFDYTLYPGESDRAGYDFWSGSAAKWVTQNLDFTTYTYYGFDPVADMGAVQTTGNVTGEGIVYDKNVVYNNNGSPMLEYLVMGDMNHQHYNRYARIIWNDLFSHYSRDPETGALYYDGELASTEDKAAVTAAYALEQAKAAQAAAEVANAKAEAAKNAAAEEAAASLAEAAEKAAEAEAAQKAAEAALESAQAAAAQAAADKLEAQKTLAEAQNLLTAAQAAQAKAEAALAESKSDTAQAVTITTNKKTYTVKVGKTVKIKATASDGSKITFTSKNKKIAKVNKNGKITGVKKGTTRIVLKAGTAKVRVTVKVS